MSTLSAPTSPSRKGYGLGSGFDDGLSTLKRRSKKDRLSAIFSGGRRDTSNSAKHAGGSADQLPAFGGRYSEAEVTTVAKKSSLPRFGRSHTDSQLQQWNDQPATSARLTSGRDQHHGGSSILSTAYSPNRFKGDQPSQSIESKPKLGIRLNLRRRSSKRRTASEEPSRGNAGVASSLSASENPPEQFVAAQNVIAASGHTPELHQQQYLSDISLNSTESKTSAARDHTRMRLVGDPGIPNQRSLEDATQSGSSPNVSKGFKPSTASRIRRSLRLRRNSASGRPGSSSSSSAPPQSAGDPMGKSVAVIPGSFRRVSGIRDQRIVTDGTVAQLEANSVPGSRSASTTAFERVVDIRREQGKPFGFKFIFELPRKSLSTGADQESDWEEEPCAYVTQVVRNSMIDIHRLLEVGDRIMAINGVSVSSARRAQDLREMVQTAEQLVMTVRSPCEGVGVAHSYTLPKGRPIKSDPKEPAEYEYSPQPRSQAGLGYQPGELAGKGMSRDLFSQLSVAVAKRPQASTGHAAVCRTDGAPSHESTSTSDVVDVGSEAENTSTNQEQQGEAGKSLRSPQSVQAKLVESMDAILEDASLTGDAKQEAIAKHLGTALDLPFLSEPASYLGFSDNDLDEDDQTSSDPIEVRNISEKMAHSVLSLVSNDDDGEIFAEVRGDEILGDQTTVAGSSSGSQSPSERSVSPVEGFMLVRLLDGSGLASTDSSHLYCVLDVGGSNTAARSSSLQATGGNTILWDEDFDIDLECTRQLVISIYTISPGKDVLRAQTALHLQPLFSSARLRRIRLLLPNGGILRLKLAYADRMAILRRLPSASQYGTFGICLSQVVLRERVTVPLIVQKCIYEIDRRGLRHIGLYRVNGSSKKKRALRKSFEGNSRTAMLSEEHVPDINVIVGLLKEYLRELPEPLLTHALYSDLIESVKPSKDSNVSEESARRKRLYKVLSRLPQAEMDTCRMLFSHLQRVLQNSSSNQMTAHNLAICLGPVLMMPSPQSPKKVPKLVAQDINAQIGVIFHILVFGWPESAGQEE